MSEPLDTKEEQIQVIEANADRIIAIGYVLHNK